MRLELGDAHETEDIEAEMREEPTHWLAQFQPEVTTGPTGRTEIRLVMVGSTVQSSALTTIALVRACEYDLRALHVEG